MTEPQQIDGMIQPATTKRRLRNRCCCNIMDVTTATLLIGCLELCYFSYEIFSTIYHFIQTGEQYLLSLSISLFGIFLALIASILLLVAIKTSTPYLLVPHLLMQAAAICVLTLVCLFCLFAVIVGTSLDFRVVNVEENDDDSLTSSIVGKPVYELTYISKALKLILSFTCVLLISLTSIQVWMLIIVFRCFFHLQEKTILKSQCVPVNSEARTGIGGSKRQDSTTNDDTKNNNNCFSLEMNSTKFVRES
uniref:Uncharacterized protein n=1 Tax=Setaria digitata TaxID=48799 RepID=A0A915Q3R8_9BILA